MNNMIMLGFFSVYERLFSHFVKILLDELNELQLQLNQKKMLVKKISATNWPENRSPIPTALTLNYLDWVMPCPSLYNFMLQGYIIVPSLSPNCCGTDKLYSQALLLTM
jgi:hypothetical protein